MSDSVDLTQHDINYMYDRLGGATNKDQLQLKLKNYDADKLDNLYRYIAKTQGLTEMLVKYEWITSAQKKEIDDHAKTPPKNKGGKRRYSTRSKKYKKSNKRSKRTRTLRRKRYSRKS
jgi:hypothetical protein